MPVLRSGFAEQRSDAVTKLALARMLNEKPRKNSTGLRRNSNRSTCRNRSWPMPPKSMLVRRVGKLPQGTAGLAGTTAGP